jgi:hypothetical protein
MIIIDTEVYYALMFFRRTKTKMKKEKEKEKEKRHLPPILNIFVPQTVHMPCVAGLPFFIVTFFSSFIVLLALHLTQYASVAMDPYTDGGKRSFPRAIAMAIAQAPASR